MLSLYEIGYLNGYLDGKFISNIHGEINYNKLEKLLEEDKNLTLVDIVHMLEQDSDGEWFL